MKEPKKKRYAKEDEVLLPRDLVPHPRFNGRQTHAHRISASTTDVCAQVWQVRRSTPIPGTAMAANCTLQNYSMYPRRYYVDLLKQCKTCARPFVFYAAEQKYWFEVLKIYVDADCAKCPVCRKREHWLKGCQTRYSRRLSQPALDAKDMKALIDDAIVLLEQGVIRNLAVLGALKKRAQREIGSYGGVERFATAIVQAREAAAMRPGAHFGQRG